MDKQTTDKAAALAEIAQAIATNGVTPTLQADATQLVFGVGNPDAHVMFVGEAPGANEDKQGEPFVGAAGQFLNEMLASIGLARSDVYITNIVKYRPPGNRDPLPDEVEAFRPLPGAANGGDSARTCGVFGPTCHECVFA